MSYAEIKSKSQDPNYVPPISNRQIGWLAFAAGESIEEVISDNDKRRGWLQALRDFANSEAGTVFA